MISLRESLDRMDPSHLPEVAIETEKLARLLKWAVDGFREQSRYVLPEARDYALLDELVRDAWYVADTARALAEKVPPASLEPGTPAPGRQGL